MNRREFLLTSSVAAVAAMAPVHLIAANKTSRPLRKAIWYSNVPGRTVLERFENAKAAGFDGIEPPTNLDESEILDAQDKTGVAVPSIACGQHSRLLTNPDPAKRGAGVEGIKDALRKAKRFGASSILTVVGAVTKEVSYADAWQRAQGELLKITPLAEELNVKLAFENVWNHFILSPLEAARFVDELKSPAAGWHFDVGNVVYLGWPEQWIEILGPRIQKVHIKEFSRRKMNETGLWTGFDVEFLEGDCDWPSVMRALEKIRYKNWAIVEPAWTPKNVDPMVRLKQIADKVDKILTM